MSDKEYLVAVDPGDTTGVAVLNMESGEAHELMQFSLEEFLDWSENYDWSQVKQVVIEDFILFGHKAKQQTGSKFKATQVIGALKGKVRKHGIPLSLQQSNILPIGAKLSGVPQPKTHSRSHQIDAFNHGFYWLVRNRGIPNALERKLTAERIRKEAGEG